MKYVDLSVEINENTPVYPGDPKVRIETAGEIVKDEYTDHIVTMGTHLGTHIDAPLHMVKNGKRLSDFSVNRFVGRGKYIDATAGFSVEALKVADISEGDILLFYTGMGQRFYEPVYFNDYPAMSDEMAHYIVDRKVGMVGFDTCSADNLESFPIHKILLSGDVLIIENMANLKELRGKKFKIYALPLKFNLDGCPARVIAEVES